MDENRKKLLIELLKEVDPKKPYGTELFDVLAWITVSVAIEAVCLRTFVQTGDIEEFQHPDIQVYLVQRSPDDTAYPGEWHCPGSVWRPGENLEHIFKRLAAKEFATDLVSTEFVANINPSSLEPEVRGTFLSIVYLCVLEQKEGLRGKWFSVYDLPEKTVISHRKRIIPAALGVFVAANYV